MGLSFIDSLSLSDRYKLRHRLEKKQREEEEARTKYYAAHRAEEARRNENPPKQATTNQIMKKGTIHLAYEVFLQWKAQIIDEGFVQGIMKREVTNVNLLDVEVHEMIADIVRIDGDTVSPEFIEKSKRCAEKCALEEIGRKISL